MRQQANRVTRQAAERVRGQLRRRGLDVVRYRDGLPHYVDSDAARAIRAAAPYTMTATESLFSLVESVRYIVRNDIPGSFVECGVWKGGSVIAIASTLLQLGVTDRDIYLYDTFEGMTAPTADDVLLHGDATAAEMLASTDVGDGANVWCVSSLADVRAAVATAGYPETRLHYVEGPVEQTLPEHAPDGPIALLRLDTDWYESTLHELQQLEPRIPSGGVLVVDDYWHWGGCRKAVDEYVASTGTQIMFTRVDITAVGTVHRS